MHYYGVCCCGCGTKILPGEPWQLDHKDALINGGEHRETNLWPIITAHHKEKTKSDVAEKAKIYRKRLAHYGIKKAKGRPIPGSKRSRFKRKMDGTVVRR